MSRKPKVGRNHSYSDFRYIFKCTDKKSRLEHCGQLSLYNANKHNRLALETKVFICLLQVRFFWVVLWSIEQMAKETRKGATEYWELKPGALDLVSQLSHSVHHLSGEFNEGGHSSKKNWSICSFSRTCAPMAGEPYRNQAFHVLHSTRTVELHFNAIDAGYVSTLCNRE